MHVGQNFPIIICSEVYASDGKNLLVFHRHPNNQWLPGKFVVPGGRVELDEDVLSGAIREVREETGIKIPKRIATLKAVVVHHEIIRKETFLVFIFFARFQKTSKIPRSNNEGSAQWVPIKNIRKNGEEFPLIRHYLSNIVKRKNKIIFTSSDWRSGNLLKIHSWMES